MIYVIGDSHIGLADGSETKINEWIDRLAAVQPKPQALYLNGDVFHYLIARRNFRTSAVDRVLEKLGSLKDRGIAVHYVEGNRDFFIRGSFVEDFVSDIAVEFAIPAGSRRYLITHGDMINDRDWKYRFWRRASKNFATKAVASLVPKRAVDAIERRLAGSNFKHKYRLPVELMQAYGEKRSREGFTDVVFGHFHNKLVMPGPGATVTVLPAWYESGEAMRIDPSSGEFEFVVI